MNSTEKPNPQHMRLLEGILSKIRPKLTALYCDTGPFAGMWRLRVGEIYLTDDEIQAVNRSGGAGASAAGGTVHRRRAKPV